MTQALDQASQDPNTEAEDPLAAIQRVLEASSEPLTPSKIRAQLSAKHKSANLEDILQRQVTAQVLYQFPKYRSQQDRFWDRPMPVHLAALLQETLADGPLNVSELRRKLPAYAQPTCETVLQEEIGKGKIHRHPKVSRGGERFGVKPADPKEYLKTELIEVFRRLEGLGFQLDKIRAAAIELLHEEEWSSLPENPKESPPAPTENVSDRVDT